MSPQSGIRFSAQKLRKLMFIGTMTGMVSATTRAPSAAQRSMAASWLR